MEKSQRNGRGPARFDAATRDVKDAAMDVQIALDAIIPVKRAAIQAQIVELRELEARREQIRVLNLRVAA